MSRTGTQYIASLKDERAVYVVNPDPSQAARLIVTIPLAQP